MPSGLVFCGPGGLPPDAAHTSGISPQAAVDLSCSMEVSGVIYTSYICDPVAENIALESVGDLAGKDEGRHDNHTMRNNFQPHPKKSYWGIKCKMQGRCSCSH
ncbi:hypothetical protein KIL84_021894 [Mauremys mutica]|uniref:Uncharacterized protein n=1 Tax=Mauremys mutica TaxID=74926 RepID=A0A9D4B3Q6_9SAUR|nr:hypothetical protein KIL84_021894 [Mauremys mutica]